MLLVDSWDKYDDHRPIVLNCILQFFALTLCRTAVEKEGRSLEKGVVLDLLELEKDPRVRLIGWPEISGRLVRESRDQEGDQRSLVARSRRSLTRALLATTCAVGWPGNW